MFERIKKMSERRCFQGLQVRQSALAHSLLCLHNENIWTNLFDLFQVVIFIIMIWNYFNQKEKKRHGFISSRNMIIQSSIDESHYCCPLTHPHSADSLTVIWSQGQSQLNSHCDTLKYKMVEKRTYQESDPETNEQLGFLKHD